MAANRTVLRLSLCRHLAVVILALSSARTASAQDLVFQFDAAQSIVKFTLGAALHTVHGTFRLKAGSLRVNPFSEKVSGDIVVGANSGETGNGMRDRKMHKEVLESERYADIVFRPDRLGGTLAAEGKSSLQIHGILTLHGLDHEITVPAVLATSANHWTAKVNFVIPYVQWGIKNPSTFFLHVSDDVEIEIDAAGTLSRETDGSRPAQ